MFVDDRWRRALLDAVAAVVGMIPEGLVLLTSLAFGVAAIQLATRKVLVQELAAVEVLARVDVLCLDKTGTLTTGELRCTAPSGSVCGRRRRCSAAELAETALAAFGSDEAGNATSGILGSRFRSDRFRVTRRIPFSSATKYSALAMTVDGDESSWVLGAPERVLEAHPDALARATELGSDRSAHPGAGAGCRSVAGRGARSARRHARRAGAARAAGRDPAAGGARHARATSASRPCGWS